MYRVFCFADGNMVLPGARSYIKEDFSCKMHTGGTPTSARRLSDPGILWTNDRYWYFIDK